MNSHQILLILALGFLIPSLIIPWVDIDFIGESHSYTPLKISKSILINDKSDSVFDLVKIIRPYKLSSILLISSMTLYFGSLLVLIDSTINGKKQNKIYLILGLLLILSVIFYALSIEIYKSEFSNVANKTGGIIGEEFKGKENLIINNIIKEGYGYKLTIIGSVFLILSYFWKEN